MESGLSGGWTEFRRLYILRTYVSLLVAKTDKCLFLSLP